jgi:DNA helicase-2/ATP-dependent DNA helicase PcrA
MLTDEQKEIISAARDTNDNLVVDAKAGSGKTTTLLEVLAVLRGTSILQAFNRSIADEIRQKTARKFDAFKMADIQIATVHSHGLKAFNKAGMKAKTLDGKVMFMLRDMLDVSHDRNDDIWRNLGKVTRLVSAAKSSGFGLSSPFEDFPRIEDRFSWLDLAEHHNLEEDLAGETDIEEVVDLAMKMLKMSNARTNSIDFDDMIYLPLLLNLPLPQYNNVLIDEAQDINATRRELAFRTIKPGGRIIAVGDPNQAIYGFTGADVESLANIRRRAKAVTFPLSICWRCDASIIESAQQQVPDIYSRPGAPDGQVLSIDFEQDDFLSLPKAGDAILCRVNKPNVAACLGLLRRGVRAKIEGRDIGKRLEHHVQKANPLYASQTLEDTLLELETYKEIEIGKLVAKNKAESTIAILEDEIDAAALIVERVIESLQSCRSANWTDFTLLLGELFGDKVTGCVVLSSVHKAKGREWPRVFILGYEDWMPHKMAKKPWEKEQEQNLIYVAKTRAEHALIFVNGAQSAIDRGLHREVKKPDAQPTAEQRVEALEKIPVIKTTASAIKVATDVGLAMPSLSDLEKYRRN